MRQLSRGLIRLVVGVVVSCAGVVGGGCATYVTPGQAADFRALGITADEQRANTDVEIRRALDRKPLASFPASIAVIHVQGEGYRSFSSDGYGQGSTTVVTLRDAEMQTGFDRIGKLPMVRGVAMVNRMVAPNNVRTEKDLRVAAANLQADMTMIYTFETQFGDETVVPFMGTITLGLFPAKEAKVTTTCSAALIDTRSGYVYGLAESTVKEDQLANAWTSKTAIDQSRRRAESKAFVQMVDEMEQTWKGVVDQYTTPTAVLPAAQRGN